MKDISDNDRYYDHELSHALRTADQNIKRGLEIQRRIDELKWGMAAHSLTNAELSELIDLTAEALSLRDWMDKFESKMSKR